MVTVDIAVAYHPDMKVLRDLIYLHGCTF